MWREPLLKLSNWVTRRRKVRVAPENLLLLVPHCLQQKQCDRNVSGNLDSCGRCGRCNIGELLALRDELGIQCRLASGGREAVEWVRAPEVMAVVAVACEKELLDGLFAIFPRAVLVVPNVRSEGPCRNTRVDVAQVRRDILRLIAPPAAARV